MVDFIDFKELFDSWSFIKADEEAFFMKELSKLTYVDGELYWADKTVVNQTQLVKNGGEDKCGLDYDRIYVGGTNTARYEINLSDWRPNNFHNNQKAIIEFESGEYKNVMTNQTLKSSLSIYKSQSLAEYTSFTPPVFTEGGKVKVIVLPYHDVVEDVYYSGVAYELVFSDLQTYVKYFTVSFFEDEVNIYVPMSGNIDMQELMIMEEDYEYPMSSVEYIYIFANDLLYHRVASNGNNGDWELVNEDTFDIDGFFKGRNVIFSCYRLSNTGLNSSNYDKGLLIINEIFEISTGNTLKF